MTNTPYVRIPCAVFEQAIRLTLRPHLLKMQGPSDLPPTGSILEGEVVRIDSGQGLLLKVGYP